MKTIKTWLLIGLLSVSIKPAEIYAQDIDANRMNRDIRIMENILGEIFKTQIVTQSDETIIINGYSLRNRSVRGTYLPGYGIIFMVSANDFYGPGVQVENGYSFYYSTDDNGGNREVDEESVETRITEFLADYGSTISQLKDNEHVMVIYGANQRKSNRFFRIAVNGKDVQNEEDLLPVISVSATFKDLKDYRTGRIDEPAFENRLKTSFSQGEEYLDLKVMGNIFETALTDREESRFRMSGGINYLMLDNFGAIFNFDVRYSEDNRSYFRALNEAGKLMRALEEQRTRQARGRVASSVQLDQDQAEKLKQEEAEQKQMILDSFEELKQNLKEYIADYGRTLSSVKSGQYVLVSINVSGRFDEIADRVDFQVRKSVLEQLDQGSISRDEALNQIIVTEY